MERQSKSPSFFLRTALVVGACLFWSVQPVAAEKTTDTPQLGVRYSLKPVWIGADARPTGILMPVATRLSGKTLEQKLNTVFGAMKRTAAARYGATSLASKINDTTQKLEVYVWLDETKAEHHPQIIAETVYTFTEMGLAAVNYPKFKLEPLTRNDIDYPAFSLSLPAWRALDLKSRHILTQLSDGARVSADVFVKRLESGDSIALNTVWKDFERSDDAALRILKVATRLQLPNRSSKCLSSIESAETALRIAAIDCLVNAKPTAKSKEALRLTLKEDPEASVQEHALKAMQSSSDTGLKTMALLHDLSSSNVKAVLASIEALRSLKDKRINAAFATLLQNDTADVHNAAQAALIERGQAKVLVASFSNAKLSDQRKRDIAMALVVAKVERDAAIQFLASRATSKEWAVLSTAMKELSKKKRLTFIEAALGNQDKDMRLNAVSLLAAESGSDSIKVLLNAKTEDPDVQKALDNTLLTLCGALSTAQLFKETKSKDLRLKGCAIDALSQKSRTNKRLKKRLVPVLVSLARDKDESIRANAIAGLGNLADPKTFTTIKKALKDKSDRVLASAVGALRNFDKPEIEEMLKSMSNHSNAEVLAQVARSYGVRGYDSGVPIVLGYASRTELPVRVESTQAVVRFVSQGKTIKTSFDFFTRRLNDENSEVRIIALSGLGKSIDPRRVEAISSLVQDTNENVQLTSIKLLGDTQDQRAVEAVGSGLTSESIDVRKAAILALLKLTGPAATKTLKQHRQQESDSALQKLIDTELK